MTKKYYYYDNDYDILNDLYKRIDHRCEYDMYDPKLCHELPEIVEIIINDIVDNDKYSITIAMRDRICNIFLSLDANNFRACQVDMHISTEFIRFKDNINKVKVSRFLNNDLFRDQIHVIKFEAYTKEAMYCLIDNIFESCRF